MTDTDAPVDLSGLEASIDRTMEEMDRLLAENERLQKQNEEITGASRLRADGWSVAVHNDYRIGMKRMTFWLFTHPDGRWVKGEGSCDSEALGMCLRIAMQEDSVSNASVPPSSESLVLATHDRATMLAALAALAVKEADQLEALRKLAAGIRQELKRTRSRFSYSRRRISATLKRLEALLERADELQL